MELQKEMGHMIRSICGNALLRICPTDIPARTRNRAGSHRPGIYRLTTVVFPSLEVGHVDRAGVLFWLFWLTISTAIACSAEYPEGVISCDPQQYEQQCPKGWSCDRGLCYSTNLENQFENPIGELTPTNTDTSIPKDASDPSLIDSTFSVEPDDGGVEADVPCIPNITSCEAKCGWIDDGCGHMITCGSGTCPDGKTCEDYQCVSEYGGCRIDGVDYEPGDLDPYNSCRICRPLLNKTDWSPNQPSETDEPILCTDGKFCTVNDHCEETLCIGEPRNCDDNISCNGDETCGEIEKACVPGTTTCGEGEVCQAETDTCVPKGICQPGCVIADTCYKDKTPSPTNPCQICDIVANRTQWSIVAVGERCGNGTDISPCSSADTCDQNGECQPNHKDLGVPCEGGDDETECSGQDTCDGNGNCELRHFGTNTRCEGTPPECQNQKYCDGDGVCEKRGNKVYGFPCGQRETECSWADSCNGWGTCVPNHKGRSVACGGTPSACENQDYCDGRGGCEEKGLKPEGTICGNTSQECQELRCNRNGDCRIKNIDAYESCNETSNPCEIQDHCDGQGKCIDNGYYPPNESHACGEGETDCSDQDTCGPNGTCLENHKSTTETCGNTSDPCMVFYCDGDGQCSSDPANAPAGTACNDNNQCTGNDQCDGAGNCEGSPNTGQECGSGPVLCSLQDTCNESGECQPNHAQYGTLCREEEGQPCASQYCDGQGSCNVYASATTPCDDGNECTENDHCDGSGGCKAGTYREGNCGEGPSPNGCSAQDTCENGVCVPNHMEQDHVCEERDPLDYTCAGNTTYCDGSGGCTLIGATPDGEPCDDDDPCTTEGVCQDGICTGIEQIPDCSSVMPVTPIT